MDRRRDRNLGEIEFPQVRGVKVTDTVRDTFRDTHRWLTFELDLTRCHPNFWMLLGEIRSKCDHMKYAALGTDTARELMTVYFAKGVAATTAIEGNTLSVEQVRERMQGQLDLPASKEYLGQEIDNMLAAYNGILTRVEAGEHLPISIETLKALNSQILEGLELEPHVQRGRLRRTSVAAGTYLAPPWDEVEGLLVRLCEWLERTFVADDPAQRIPIGFIKAVLAHLYIEWIHPFGDGNGRLGRLVEFLILIESGVPSPAAHVLTSHYNDTRSAYYRQLHQASANGGDVRDFLLYAAQGMVDGLGEAIKRLHKQQEELMWRLLVDEAFIDRRGDAAHRQRLVALNLVRAGWVTKGAVRTLAPEVIEAYLGKTTKTLTRDVNRLEEMGFLVRGPQGFRANLSLVRGMRPFVVEPDDPLPEVPDF